MNFNLSPGMSALMFAVYRNRPYIARLLVQHNCDIDLQSDLRFLAHLSEEPVRFAAIELAVAFRRKETAIILLEAGCCRDNILQFLLLRLPHVTPDRTRSMLRTRNKVSICVCSVSLKLVMFILLYFWKLKPSSLCDECLGSRISLLLES